MALHEYRRKRDFQRTPEPPGRSARSATGRLYVLQKHAARQVHYDLRLELDGTLLSWAVPKGPSLDPQQKRLAVQVEDHPIEYGAFEGTIPEGAYGGGTVMLWDRGEWSPLPDPKARHQLSPQEAYREGKLKFELHGQKLRGGWTLVRMKGESGGGGKNWLLIKERDAEVRREDDYSIIDQEPFSAATNRTMREIASDNDNVWTDGGATGPATAGKLLDSHWARRTAAVRPTASLEPGRLMGARLARLPAKLVPEQPSPAKKVPEGDAWLHEIQLDGQRLLCLLRPEQVELRTLAGQDLAGQLPDVARAVSLLPVEEAVLDGVLVVFDARGVSDAAALQRALESRRRESLQYFLLDLLYCDGFDLRATPLIERKQLLQKVLEAAADRTPCLHYGDHVRGNGPTVYAQACRLGVAGLLSKRADSRYTAARSRNWLRVPCDDPNREPARVRISATAESHDASNTTYLDPQRRAGPRRNASAAPASSRRPRSAPSRQASVGNPQSAIPTHGDPSRGVSRSGTPVVAEPGFELHGVRITNPDRILYPEERITKRDLALFYQRVADWILPHVVHRPLSLYRCPSGHEKECFFQKHLGEMKTAHLREAPVREGEGKEPYIALDDVRGLITLAQLAVLEIHPWGCREDNIERPDRLIFDLDPGPDVPWGCVVDGALGLRELLAMLGLQSFVKTSGGKGLHIVAPLVRRCGWEALKQFAQAVARHIVKLAPHRYTATMTKSKRPGRVFIDYFRNHRGATCVAPYSTRARAGAPVSTPIAWDELGPQPVTYTIPTLLTRVASLPVDPWEGFFTLRQSLTKATVAKMQRLADRRPAEPTVPPS